MSIVRRMNALVWVGVVAMVGGCGGSGSGPALNVGELGLSMQLPDGWKVDGRNPRMFHALRGADDNFGMVEDYPLGGKTFAEYVDSITDAGGARTISKTPMTVGGYEAVEMVNQAEYTVIEVNIQKGDRVIRVSARALTDEFPQHEGGLRAALGSIRVQ